MKIMRIALVTFLALFAVASSVLAQGRAYKVIVNPSNPVSTMSKDDLARIFMKKSTKFPDGRSANPVDLTAAASVRDSFSHDVHGKPAAAIDAYWQQQIFAGRDVPPPQKSEGGALDFVRSNPNAIGYVSAGTPTEGVKVINITD